MFSNFFVLASIIACAISATIPKGLIPMLDGRIVGGQDTTIEEFPHQVSLRRYGSHFCGGSVYSDKVILTAAHCAYGSSASSITVVLGATHLSESGVKARVKKIYVHEDFSMSTIDNDIAVLVLEEPLTFTDSIQPIPLQETGVEVEAGTKTIVSGWGTLREGGYLPDVLQYVEVEVIDHDTCSNAYKYVGDITESMLCAAVENGGKDACQGDSGGPLIANGKQIGVVSWGYGCARPKYPGVYSKVSYLHGWVNRTLEKHGL